ncbi:barstar family protein [Micromonospora sp. NBC_01796]|uniref:barstar family protein n=1 Tax=Micromonospora sp. NBC_01796 TaxID=2975987 RepID=UPI002DDAD261|nr:barstar family protein [Micromonospora sp. NBC_01796]WSA86681.1 barstar family protein [Micromonospora sp. NBC_01796]
MYYTRIHYGDAGRRHSFESGEGVEFRPGVMAVAASEIEAATASARMQGMRVYSLSTGAGGGRDAFFDAVRATLPLDPPLASNYSWDALADSIFGGLVILDVDRVLVVWTDAAEMTAAAPVDADTAASVLVQTAADLAEPRYTQGHPVFSVTVLMVTEPS